MGAKNEIQSLNLVIHARDGRYMEIPLEAWQLDRECSTCPYRGQDSCYGSCTRLVEEIKKREGKEIHEAI